MQQTVTEPEAAVRGLLSMEEAAALIKAGEVLWISGDEALLRKLPRGRWVGGTIHYFMAADGGVSTREQLFVTEFPAQFVAGLEHKVYDAANIHTIATDTPEHGFAMLLVPSGSDVHLGYAERAPTYQGMFRRIIVGWVTGVHLSELGTGRALAFDGESGKTYSNCAVAMLVHLSPGKGAGVGVVNPFQEGSGGILEFPATGFSATECLVNGEQRNIVEYLQEVKADTRLPLIGDYPGAKIRKINVSFQNLDTRDGRATFYAPVFQGVKYRLAAPLVDYVAAFQSALPEFDGAEVVFSCNCILNYLHMELEGRKIAGSPGPMTFGEIAYQLLNQTMVYLTVTDTTPRS
ncbi:MAG: hypothetical protein HYR49_08405 [Gammaproteobacteria bacterium]|nr:hypothetical protein [Gammaproteobacteria bacterium]